MRLQHLQLIKVCFLFIILDNFEKNLAKRNKAYQKTLPKPLKFIQNSGMFSQNFKNMAGNVFDFTQKHPVLTKAGASLGAAALSAAGSYLYKNRGKIAKIGKKLFKNTVDAISLPFSNFFNSSKKKRRKMSQEQPQEIKPILPESPISPVNTQPEPAPEVKILPSSGGLQELDVYNSPPASQAVVEDIVPEEPLPMVSQAAAVQLVEPVQETPNLVPVKGNTKVYRCLKCKTFVSATKPHTAAECAARKSKEVKSTTSTHKRRRKVDKELLKNFRILEKRNVAVAAKGAVISKKAQSLMKKFSKKSKKSSPTIPKQIMNFLDSLSKKF